MNKLFAPALYKDNLRRTWGITIVATLWLYLGAMFEITMQTLHGGRLSTSFVVNMLANRNAAYMALHLFLPVIAAVAVFSYLNKVNSTNAFNAWPLNRRSMYFTNWLSGITICLIPLVINFIMMSAFSRELPQESYAISGAEIYTIKSCFGWLISSVVIELFIYSIAVIGCLISGNGIIAFLTGIALNFVVPALIMSVYTYLVLACWGFRYDGSEFMDAAMNCSPWIRAIFETNGWLELLIYALVAISITWFGMWIYYIRNMERATDSYVFEPVRACIAFILTFFSTTLAGTIFFSIWGYMSYVIGFAIGFIVSQMITYKSFRIFNKKVLKNMIIFAIAIGAINFCSSIDILGLSAKVPAADEVASVDVSLWTFPESNIQYNVVQADGELINKTIDMHKSVLEHKDSYKFDERTQDYEHHGYITIHYDYKNGKTLSRDYTISTNNISDDQAINAFKDAAEAAGFKIGTGVWIDTEIGQ